MFYSDEQVAINELVILYQESVDHLRSVAGRIEHADLLAEFERMCDRHSAAVDAVSRIVRSLGALPRAPDIDKENLQELLVRAKAALSGDERTAFLDDRIAANKAIREHLSQALSLEFDADTRAELERLLTREKEIDRELYMLRAKH